jgi:transposase
MSDMSSRKVEDRLTAGLDLGDLYTHMCVLNESGEVVEEARIASTPKAFRQRFRTMPPARLVLEAGTHSPWASRLLESVGHEVIVANPRMLRFIYGNDSKNDRADAAYLARVGKLDPGLLHPLIHRSEEGSAHRALLRSREALVGGRARLIIHTRSLVKPFGARLPRCSTDAFATKVLDHVPEILRPALEPVISVISAFSLQIQELDQKIEALARDTYPETALLSQVPGVGRLTALAYVLTVEDPTRFRRARAMGSYLGLRPRQDESGTLKPQLPITKAGDRMLRRLLVECSQRMLTTRAADTDLRRWGLKLCERGGKAGRKRAAVAVARKLSVLLLRLWMTGEVYEPLRNAKRRGELLPSSS